MGLFQKLFPKAAQLDAAERALEAAKADASEAKQSLKNLWESYHAHDAALQKLRAELSEAQQKVRAQNEADLLLVSMQIIQRITAGEKKETSSGLQSLLMQQQALQSAYPIGAYNMGMGAGSYLGLAGLGGFWRQ